MTKEDLAEKFTKESMVACSDDFTDQLMNKIAELEENKQSFVWHSRVVFMAIVFFLVLSSFFYNRSDFMAYSLANFELELPSYLLFLPIITLFLFTLNYALRLGEDYRNLVKRPEV